MKKTMMLRIFFWISIFLTIILANFFDNSMLGFFVLFITIGIGIVGLIAELIIYTYKYPATMKWVIISVILNTCIALYIPHLYNVISFDLNQYHEGHLSHNNICLEISTAVVAMLVAIVAINTIIFIVSKKYSIKTGVKTKYKLMAICNLVVYILSVTKIVYL